MPVREVGDPKILNLGEMADLLDITSNTLRALIKKNPDFPIESAGDHGVAYQFDADQVVAWWQSHTDQVEAAKADRAAEIDQMRLELFGEDPAPEIRGFTPSERRAEIEAQLAHDKLRRQRGDLLDRAAVENQLRQAFAELAKGMRQIVPDIARDHGLDRKTRTELESSFREKFNAAIDRVQNLIES